MDSKQEYISESICESIRLSTLTTNDVDALNLSARTTSHISSDNGIGNLPSCHQESANSTWTQQISVDHICSAKLAASTNLKESGMISFLSPYWNASYYHRFAALPFALDDGLPSSLFDIVRDWPKNVDSFIKVLTHFLVLCFPGVDEKDRLSDMKIDITLPLYIKLCIEYIEVQRITERNVRRTYIFLFFLSHVIVTIDFQVLHMVKNIKEGVLDQANVAKDRVRLVKPLDHCSMIFEAALIAVLARHPSNLYLLDESPESVFRPKFYAVYYRQGDKKGDDFQMFFRYYWAMRVAAPLFFISKNTGLSLRLLPRLVEAKNVEYQYGGKSSASVKFRIAIFTVVMNNLKLSTDEFSTSSLDRNPTVAAQLGASLATENSLKTTQHLPPTSTSAPSSAEKSQSLTLPPLSEAHLNEKLLEYALYQMEIIQKYLINKEDFSDDEVDFSVFFKADKAIKDAARGYVRNHSKVYELVYLKPRDHKRFAEVEENLCIVPIVKFNKQDETMESLELRLEVQYLVATLSNHDHADLSSKIRKQRAEVPSVAKPFVDSFNQHFLEMTRGEEVFKKLCDCYLSFARRLCLEVFAADRELITSAADNC
jgi:hypothetical protein